MKIIVHSARIIVNGDYLYMTSKDLADLKDLSNWEPYDARKHKAKEHEHIKPTMDDFAKLFPEHFPQEHKEDNSFKDWD